MKILNVNHINQSFKRQTIKKNSDNANEVFIKLLNDAPLASYVSEKGDVAIAPKKERATCPCIVNTDIINHTKRVKKPLPFSLSDKKLILDEYQEAAIELFRDGKNVMVTAPTGTGKTLIAEHAINDVIKTGKRVIYTTPLKALCNDKYKQFSVLWGDYDNDGNLIGSSKVGLATGDVKINTNAPIVIMTTEVYRNMLTQHGQKDIEKKLKNVGAVIFDEFHYMGDSQRGSVWEEALMLSPSNTRHLMLSATIANANPIINWLNSINDNHSSVLVNVPEDERHVPLKYLSYSKLGSSFVMQDLLSETVSMQHLRTKNLSSKERDVLSDIGTFFNEPNGIAALERNFRDVFYDYQQTANVNDFVQKLINYGIAPKKAEQYGLRLVNKNTRKINSNLSKIQSVIQPPIIDLVKDMERKDMTPALYFVYSKRKCKDYMKEVSEKVGQLLTAREQNEIKKRIEEVKGKGIFLGVNFEQEIMPCLLNGFAMHNSGMLPQCKSFIEELGRNKLIKVCFATDTLGAGINFPFKTVVFGSFEKYTDDVFEEISVNSFKQGAGRAGRRGIDDIGYVISIPKDKDEVFVPYNKIVQEADDVRSAFQLSYGLILSPRFLNQPITILGKSFDNFQRKTYDENLQKSYLMKEILRKRKFIEYKNGTAKLTPKGKIASKIRGINEILITEILSDSKITEGLSPSELAGLVSMFAPERQKENQNLLNNAICENFPKAEKVINIAYDIKNMEEERGINSEIAVNPQVMPYIKMWAEIYNNSDNSVVWSDMIKTMTAKNIIKDEGDFFKKINFTTNILKQIQKAAPTKYLKETARMAVNMLQKSPVNDILLYELGGKVINE